MAWKAEKPCKYPGCINTTPGRYCKLHAAQAQREYSAQRRDYNKQYDRRWQKIRDLYISKHPLCERCEAAGRLVPAEEVHHITPLSDGGDHRDSNLQALCKSCHSSITLTANKGNRAV